MCNWSVDEITQIIVITGLMLFMLILIVAMGINLRELYRPRLKSPNEATGDLLKKKRKKKK